MSTEGSNFFFVSCTCYSTAVQHQHTWEVEAIWIMGETQHFLNQPNSCLTYSAPRNQNQIVWNYMRTWGKKKREYDGVQGYWILRGNSQIWPRRRLKILDQYHQKSLAGFTPGRMVDLNYQQYSYYPCCHLIIRTLEHVIHLDSHCLLIGLNSFFF